MKRLNPKTNLPFVRGDAREDGLIFRGYTNRIKKDGFFAENWASEKAIKDCETRYIATHKYRLQNDPEYIARRQQYRDDDMSTKAGHINKICSGTKHRAKIKNIPFNLTAEYLLSIAPDFCPIFNSPLSWCRRGGKSVKQDCPSLDKIIPELGYIEGNVQWVSFKANAMKFNATFDELHKFANWVKETIPKS